jgi:NitT/TauT family transport system permease protein
MMESLAAPAAAEGRGSRRAARYLLPLATWVLFLASWWALVRLTRTTVFPTPNEVGRALVDLVRRGVLPRHVGTSLMRVLLGFGTALVFGVPLGLVLGLSPRMSTIVNPVIQLLRPISPIAWIPIAIVLFGVGTPSTIFLIVLAAFFPIVTSAMVAVRSIPDIYLRVGRNFGLRGTSLFRRLILPAALPEIVTGARIALGISWVVVVAGEMVAVESGLGYMIIDARNAGKRYDLVVGGMLLIGLIGLALDTLVRRVERMRALRWGYRLD